MNGRIHWLVGLGLVVAGIVGCGSSEIDIPEDPNVLNPVMGGAIKLNGKSIPSGAIITFHPTSGGDASQKISGTYNADEGYFTVMTLKGQEKLGGAPEGVYTMTIQPPRNKPGSVPAKYGNPATSGLTVEVKAGQNTNVPESNLTP